MAKYGNTGAIEHTPQGPTDNYRQAWLALLRTQDAGKRERAQRILRAKNRLASAVRA